MQPRVIIVGFVTAVVAMGGMAHAQAPADKAKAQAQFEAGKAAFRVGDFDEAITDWKAAYKIIQDPTFLFNIAQAYREKKDYEHTIFFYESYLREAKNPPNRATVEARIAEMRKLLDDQKAAMSAPPTGLGGEEGDTSKGGDTHTTKRTQEGDGGGGMTGAQPVVSDTGNGGRGLKISGAVTGGIGAALLITGIVFAAGASSAQSDINNAVSSGAVWTPELQSKYDSGKSDATLSKVTIGLGAAALVTGGVLFYLGVKKGHAAPAESAQSRIDVVPAVGARNAGLVIMGSF